MTIVVLLSAGRHPVSGDAVVPRVEAQAVRLAALLGQARGLHAGPTPSAPSLALGHGLAQFEHLRIDADADPLPFLAAALEASSPTLILAGRRSQGGAETGLVPYALAKALGMFLVNDAVAVEYGAEPGTVEVDQALPKGARRRITVRLPALVTVHPSAPPPRPFAYGQARRGTMETVEHPARSALDLPPPIDVMERPYRRRPKMMRAAPAGATAAERLKAATGDTGGGSANVLVDPDTDVAAQEILAYLRRIGVLRARDAS